MNDEATRKFIQALKRLMTFCQRRYPTDPSRCVDFDGFSNAGRGAVGGGGDKAVSATRPRLCCAYAMWRCLCLASVPACACAYALHLCKRLCLLLGRQCGYWASATHPPTHPPTPA